MGDGVVHCHYQASGGREEQLQPELAEGEMPILPDSKCATMGSGLARSGRLAHCRHFSGRVRQDGTAAIGHSG